MRLCLPLYFLFQFSGQSTDLSLALEKIEMSAESKRRARKTANIGLRDNVLILLSDGEYVLPLMVMILSFF